MDQTLCGNNLPNSMAYSATKNRQNSVSSMSTPSGGRKSLFSRVGTGNPESPTMERAKKYARGPFSMSGRSTQSIIGIRSDVNLVESYGCQLPVLINEALTFNDKSQTVSVTCAENGWAWVVHGRRLLVWQYRDTRHAEAEFGNVRGKDYSRTPQRRGPMAQCRELTLPQCDIGHKACLISVFLSDGQQMASCIAVSATGDVRYWPSIAHDGTSVDVTGILAGQEFDQLRAVPSQEGYVLVTTTCSIVFLQLQLVNGRHELQHRVLRQQSGFLGGIGKRFASLLTGTYSINDRENKFVNVQCYTIDEDRSAILAVLADRWLQLWRISNGGSTEHLLFEDGEVIRRIHEEFHQKYWSVRSDRDDVELHLLDMQLHDNKLFVLASAVSKVYAPQMHYALAKLSISATHDSVQLQDFIALKLGEFYSTATQVECLKYRLIISRHHFYIYKDNIIYPLVLSNDATVVANDVESEKIEFSNANDRIMCAAVCGEIPLFFSRTNGLVSVSPADFDNSEYFGMPFMSAAELQSDIVPQQRLGQSLIADSLAASDTNLHLYELDPDAMYGQFKDEVSLLKAAFVYRLKHNNSMCNTILNDLLQNICEAQAELTGEGTQLDKIVIKIAEDLANDIPVADPRWEDQWEELDGNKHSLGSSSSLQILTQLKEKNVALRHFVEFLHTTGIWEKLMAVPAGGGGVLKPTCYMLSDIHEKIIAAISLRTSQTKYSKIVEEAITRVVKMWQETPSGNLTAQDIFYVNLCKFQDIFTGIFDVVRHSIETHRQSNSVAMFIHDANHIVLTLLSEVSNFREKNAVIYTISAEKLETYEYMPWTAMSGKQGIRDVITQFIDITIKNGARPTGEVELKQKLYQQVLKLIDFILDGRKNCLESIRDTEKYTLFLQQFEFQRRDLITLLIEDEQYELAAQLAEKYLDFQSLVVICDATQNQERLDIYIEKFAEFNFSQFAINWHLRQNRQGEVFERFKGNQAALAQFMRDHPSLGWIQLIFNGDYERASQVLLQLAENETEFVQRKKIMLSLSKLAAHAAITDLSSCVEKINSELSIIAYQEKLSPSMMESFGYDIENPKVLSVEEIINLYIAEENETANEYDFGEALELLKFVEEPYETRHKIWCAAILRDNWLAYDMNNATDYLQSLLFFKLIEVSLMGGELDDFLPNMEEFLNSSELGTLPQQQAFKYLLKLTYEYVNDTFRKNEESEQNAMGD